jgi:predicted RNA-binding Zn-ribbon protein involved in translation (DUF1610 family)
MKKLKKKEDKVVIAGERYEGEDRPEYLCSFCNITLVRLKDSSQQNTTYWCKHCSVEFDPEAENLRKESKIVVPDRNEEAAISSIQNIPDISIRHEPELRGGFAALAKKGTIRFTSYSTTEKE